MTLRTPPGRAGRIWLAGRIETARRAGELLEQKRHVLLAAERVAAVRRREAEAFWQRCAAEAARWLERSALSDADAPFRIACAHVEGPARVAIEWRTTMGVSVPGNASVELPTPTDTALVPAGVALVAALGAHRAALRAALEAAAARTAHERVRRELESTARRMRAIESRWIPQHTRALAALELALDESDRVEGARVRWAARHQAGRSTSS